MTGAGGTGTISIGATVVVVVDGWLKLCTGKGCGLCLKKRKF